MKGIAVLLTILVAGAHAGNRCPVEQEFDWNIELLLQHPDCDKFYKCTYGHPVEQLCPSGLFYNVDLQQCDWASNVDCAGRNGPDSEPVPEAETETKPEPEVEPRPEPEPEPPTDIEEGSGQEEIEFQENGCPKDPHIHWLVPSSTDCNQFYQCVWGEIVPRSCSPGLHFNPVLQVCDRPGDAGCNVPDEDESKSDEDEDSSEEDSDESDSDENDSEDSGDADSEENSSDDSNGPQRRFKYRGIVKVGVGLRYKKSA